MRLLAEPQAKQDKDGAKAPEVAKGLDLEAIVSALPPESEEDDDDDSDDDSEASIDFTQPAAA